MKINILGLLLLSSASLLADGDCGGYDFDGKCNPGAASDCEVKGKTFTCKAIPPFKDFEVTEIGCNSQFKLIEAGENMFKCNGGKSDNRCYTIENALCGYELTGRCQQGSSTTCSVAVSLPGYEVGQAITIPTTCIKVDVSGMWKEIYGGHSVYTEFDTYCKEQQDNNDDGE